MWTFMEKVVREQNGLPDGWQIYKASHGDGINHPRGFIKVSGCVPVMFKSGPRKGKPNWRSGSSDWTGFVKDEDVQLAVRSFELTTNRCAFCEGSGLQVKIGDRGTKVNCHKCKGTGKPRE